MLRDDCTRYAEQLRSLAATEGPEWEGLQLRLKEMSVHKVEENEATREKVYVVSNLRRFRIEVELIDCKTQSASDKQLTLQVRALLIIYGSRR
eukprot:1027947-Prymnesium_polylepis.1